ncbi:MAG: glycoside hydrolase family 38 C-terminal domain-containing protein [Eubacteriales bacterium]|nr:glycoside hydrolase family 38 C-terminal domain-containing protein [Eubacteriales bacterium]
MSILFELERMERLADDLNLLRRPVKLPVSEYYRKEGKAADGAVCSTDGPGWELCQIDEPWKTLDSHRWYRTSLEIPAELAGCHVEFLITTGREGQWDATNPQMLFYVNGKIVQGVDVNHREILLSTCAKAGERYEIAFLAYSGSVPGDLIIRTELVTVDDRVEKAYYDFLVPVQTARLLKKPDFENYRRILVKMGPAADALDLRVPYSEGFYRSLEVMEEILEREFYTKISEDAPVVSAVGHTHIDIAWLWTVEQTREKVLRSFSTVLELMDRYPDYRFMSSQPILYQFVKEQEPELYERIRQRVREGRWETDGAMWLESDCNLPAGESLVRQIIKGEKFFLDEFGIPSRCLWLPDVFGYSAAIPQILKKCGIPYFLTTKIAWNQFNQLPNDTFLWKGIDGSQVFVFMPTACDFDKTLGLNVSFTDTRNTTTYTGIVNPNMTLGTFKRFQNRDLTEDSLMLFGFGDGGGGPTKEMLEEAERLKYGMPGIPRLVQEPERQFFDRICSDISPKPGMPMWEGELYFEYHRGTLTSMGKNKRNNRKSEMLYEQLETLAVMGELNGEAYPEETIARGWDIILLNQFHDIIPGSAIGPVYDQTDLEYAQILAEGDAARRKLAEGLGRKLPMKKAAAPSVVIFNTQGYVRSDVAAVEGLAGQGIRSVKDGDGHRRPVQYAEDGTLLFYAEQIPAAGYKVFELSKEPCGDGNPGGSQVLSAHTFENEWYAAEFNGQMELISLTEKQMGFQLIKEGRVANQLVTYEDRPMNWDNWDVDMFYQRKPYGPDEVSAPVLKECGPVRTVVTVSRRFANSVVEQDIVLYQDLPRIDFVNRAEWKDHHVLLRVNFPLDINATKASYEIQFGNVERETTRNHSWDTAKFEVCAHKWADLSENGLGVSLLNDCKYGHSIKDGEMGLTLIKAGIYPNEHADMGHHEFTYSIYPHPGRWQEARTVEMAYDLNSPLVCAVLDERSPEPGRDTWSLVEIDQSNCFLEMMKKAEDGEGYILRIYENHNTRTRMQVHLGFRAASVEECDLLERPVRPVAEHTDTWEDVVKPYEIKTYRLRTV